jgi:hypothetical protein
MLQNATIANETISTTLAVQSSGERRKTWGEAKASRDGLSACRLLGSTQKRQTCKLAAPLRRRDHQSVPDHKSVIDLACPLNASSLEHDREDEYDGNSQRQALSLDRVSQQAQQAR